MVIRAECGGKTPFCFDLMLISSAAAQSLTPRLMRLATTRGYPIWHGDRMNFGVFQAFRYSQFANQQSRQPRAEKPSAQGGEALATQQAHNNFVQFFCDSSHIVPSPQTVITE